MSEQQQAHPAWEKLLSILPEELHSQVTEQLKEIDKQANTKIQEQAEELKKWESVTELGHSPTEVAQSVMLARRLASNPKEIYDQIGEQYGYTPEPSQESDINTNSQSKDSEDDGSTGDLDPAVAKQLAEMRKQMESLQGTIKQQQESAKEREAAEAFNSEIARLKTEEGEFDEQWVFQRMAAGVPPKQAVKEFKQMVSSYSGSQSSESNGEQPPAAPPVVGDSGGAPPTPKIDPTTLNDDEVTDLIEQMVANAKLDD